MRRFAALSRFVLLRHLRGPLLLVGLLLFSVVVASLPRIPETGVPRLRGLASFHLGAGSLLLGLAALVLPLASITTRRRGVRGGASVFAVQGASLSAHALTLILLALLMAFASLGLLTLQEGWPDRRRAEPALRRRLAAEPAESVLLGPELPEVRYRLPFPHEGRAGGPALEWRRLRLRLRPRLILGVGGEGGLESPGGFPIEVSWRFSPRAPWASRSFSLARGRRPQLEIPVPPGVREGWLEVRLRRSERGYGVRLEEGSVALLGGSAPFYASVLRGYGVAALAAIGLMAVATWFSGFVGAAIAIAASLTVALVSAVIHPWIPGMPLVDAGRRMGEGVALAWSDLGPTALKAVLVVLVVTALPLRDRRLEGAT